MGSKNQKFLENLTSAGQQLNSDQLI